MFSEIDRVSLDMRDTTTESVSIEYINVYRIIYLISSIVALLMGSTCNI